MADTKISALPTDVVTLADGDKFPIADLSALTIDTFATALEIKTHANTAPVFAAGTASANTWPKLTVGTLLTTPEDGAIEMDADCIYGTTDAGNRGVIPLIHFTRCDSAYVLTSTVSEQSLFPAAQDTLTLETGTYRFQCIFSITGLNAASGNLAFDILGAGGATVATVLYFTDAVDVSTPTTPTADQVAWITTAQTSAAIATAGVGTGIGVFINGSFEITVAGTIQPAITLLTAAAGTVAAGSFFECRRIGSTTVTIAGQWA